MVDINTNIELPPKLAWLFGPERGALRYRGAYGGRGSGKSYTFAQVALVWGMQEPIRILCARDVQLSIRESFHAELRRVISTYPWMTGFYDVTADHIRGTNGTEFLFRGLRDSNSKIKSMSAIDLCIIEEAEDIQENSYKELIPTIRADKSELWIIWNPKMENSPTDVRFRKRKPGRSRFVEMNYMDNPWFPGVLDEDRQHDKEVLSPEQYNHIWLGYYLKNSEAQVLGGKYKIAEFEPTLDWSGPYYGLDFGFAEDPAAATKSWIFGRKLFVEREGYKKKLELDSLAFYMSWAVPGIESHRVFADCANPAEINHLLRHGLPKIAPVEKYPGSVEAGVRYLRSFEEIVVHPSCKNFVHECEKYSYRVDRLSGLVMPELVDKNNHLIDSLRYGLSPMIQKGVTSIRKMKFYEPPSMSLSYGSHEEDKDSDQRDPGAHSRRFLGGGVFSNNSNNLSRAKWN